MLRKFKIKSWVSSRISGVANKKTVEASVLQPFGFQSKPQKDDEGILIQLGPVSLLIGRRQCFDLVNNGETAIHSSSKRSTVILKEDGTILINNVDLGELLDEIHNIIAIPRACAANVCSINPSLAADAASVKSKISILKGLNA